MSSDDKHDEYNRRDDEAREAARKAMEAPAPAVTGSQGATPSGAPGASAPSAVRDTDEIQRLIKWHDRMALMIGTNEHDREFHRKAVNTLRSTDASAIRDVTCPHCNGAGEMTVYDTTRGPDGDSHVVDCAACRGTGALTDSGGHDA